MADDIDGFAAWLADEGCARSTARRKLCVTADPSLWLARQDLAVEAVDEQRLEAYMLSFKPRRGDSATVRKLLAWLREQGRVPAVRDAVPGEGPVEPILCTCECFLVERRGVSPATVVNYLPIVRAFLAERFGAREIDLRRLSAGDANRFVVGEAQRLSRSRAKLVVTALRSFPRHLHQRGGIPADLACGVLPVMRWRLSGWPKSVPPERVGAILTCCERGTAAGRRD